MRSVLFAVLLLFVIVTVPACSSSSAQSVPTIVGETTVGSNPYSLTKLGSGLVVFLSDTGTGWEPWVTDGTTAGTFQLAETASENSGSFQAGVIFGSTGLPTFIVRGNDAYFCTFPGDVWKTDGTTAGTSKIADLSPDGYEFSITAVMLDGNELRVGGCLNALPSGPIGDCKIVTIDLG